MNKQEIYNLFVQNILPKISEGIQLTKAYVFDLYGRYVTYLKVTDSLLIIIGFIFISIAVYMGIKFKQIVEIDEGAISLAATSIISCVLGIMSLCSGVHNLIQDIYIPEIRIYKILHSYK